MRIFTTKTKLLTASLALLVLFSSCASTTFINSYPSGADLYLNGEAVGQTPYEMKDTRPMFTCTSVRIEKEDYDPLYTSICRDEEVDPGAIIGGIFFFFPFIWAFKYKPTHFYKLRADGEQKETLDILMEKEDNKEE